MVGQTISHYRITDKLGEGGMGVVYRAEDTKLKRPVALKFLGSNILEDEEHKERFLREAQAAAALDHPNICTVYEIDEVEGQTFLSMAYLEGQTVKEKIKSRPLKLQDALDIAIQAAHGLHAAHEKGIVHRDIKSANLMVTPQGQVKIMDFGLAQLAERSKLTETSSILGTPSYMSPEQAVGEKTDRRTDLWSLGVVLYEMVTTRLPFEGERQEAVLFKISSDEPEPVTALRAGLPMELEWIVGKALAKAPEERYQHAEDLLVDLRSLQKKAASGTSTVTARKPPTVSAASSEGVVLKRWLRLHQGLLALATAACLVLAFLHFSKEPAEAPLRRFSFPLPEGLLPVVRRQRITISSAISPNGKHVALSARGRTGLWIQDLDQNRPRQLTTVGGGAFWSPSSDFIGFAAGGELKKI